MTFSDANKSRSAKTPASQNKAQPAHSRKKIDSPVPSPSLDVRPILYTPENLLYLQRTIGNQATLRMTTPRIQRDLSFTNTPWQDAKETKKLTSGVNPVYGIDNLVVKGLKSGGAQQEFASQLYGDLVQAPRTRAVPVNSPEGQAIIFLLKRKKILPKPEKKDTDQQDAKRERRLNPEVTVLLVMEKVTLRSLEDFTKELENPNDIAHSEKENRLRKGSKEEKNPSSFDSVINHIFESNFFRDLGRIHAMDIFLGNSDRMDRYGEVAMQNIFINVENGNYGSLGLDLDVEAASMNLVQSKGKKTGTKKAGFKHYKANDANRIKNWVLHSIKGADARRDLENVTDAKDIAPNERFGTMDSPGAMDSTDITALFDAAKIQLAIDVFRQNLEKWFPKPTGPVTNERERRGDLIGTPYYTKTLWPLAHAKFAAGIRDGIEAIQAGMQPGGKYAKLYVQSIENNPQEDIFDFGTLQIRAKYIELKKDTLHHYTEADIMARLEAFAGRLLQGWGRVG